MSWKDCSIALYRGNLGFRIEKITVKEISLGVDSRSLAGEWWIDVCMQACLRVWRFIRRERGKTLGHDFTSDLKIVLHIQGHELSSETCLDWFGHGWDACGAIHDSEIDRCMGGWLWRGNGRFLVESVLLAPTSWLIALFLLWSQSTQTLNSTCMLIAVPKAPGTPSR